MVPWVFMMLAFMVDSGFLLWIAWLLYLVVIWPAIAISIKRWHDRGKSGWWILIGFVPLIGGLWALIDLPGTSGTNQYGPDPLAGL